MESLADVKDSIENQDAESAVSSVTQKFKDPASAMMNPAHNMMQKVG